MVNLQFTDVTQIFLLLALAFALAITITPFFTTILYRYHLGKRIRDTDILGREAPIFRRYHKDKEQTPTMGGIIIWLSTSLVLIGVSFAATLFDRPDLNFLASSGAVRLLLFTLIATGLIGAADDLLNIYGIGPHRGGFAFWLKLPLYTLVAGVGSWWFAVKLDWLDRPLSVPGLLEPLALGWWYVPIFILVVVYMAFATDISDGLDGLAGGLLMIAYLAYLVIALVLGNPDLAAFCAVVVGALLAFLWFNIYPARFFMGDTGSMSLGMTLAVMAFLTKTVAFLPIIAAVIVLDGLTSPLQIISKRFLGKKIFRAAPVHHHFQALGWPEPKVVMRFWVLGGLFAVLGVAFALIFQS
ncbi:MAG: phospho-N-acetylmuramoyl-pentapeptide-transferase [Patescibacteria group bacterium]